jgi:hypothetical protein
VAVLVDPALASSIDHLVRDRHVWAARAPKTEEVAERVWRDFQPNQGDVLAAGLTLFDGGPTPEDSLLSLLDTVDLHTASTAISRVSA